MDTSSPNASASDQGAESTLPVIKRTPHYRLTAKQLRQDYDRGLITAAGYLYYIVKVSRRDGWAFAIDDIAAFCKAWGLKRATFYDAKAKCVTLGLLKETIQGRVILQAGGSITPIHPDILGVEFSTHDGNPTGAGILDANPEFRIECRNFGHESGILDSDTLETKTPRSFGDSYRSFTDLNSDLSQPHPPQTAPERETEFNEEELIEFVIKDVDRTINREKKVVAAVRPYAKKCLRDDRDYWVKRYQEHLKRQAEIESSAAPPSTLFEPETNAERRERLLKMWAVPGCRVGIKKAIAASPELKLEIVGDELREVEP